jgi:hypothetical protein
MTKKNYVCASQLSRKWNRWICDTGFTKLLKAIKESLQRYCSTAYSRSGVNQMWTLKNTIELTENLKSRGFIKIDSIETYDFATLYTTIPNNKLKSRLFQIIDIFKNKIGTRKYKSLVIGKQVHIL